MSTSRTQYKRHRYPAEIIRYAVWLYHRFNLSPGGLLAINLIVLLGVGLRPDMRPAAATSAQPEASAAASEQSAQASFAD